MILTSIHLHPFAGSHDRHLSFTEGLNVILGDNDLGKSTLFKALEACLFIHPKPSLSTVEGKLMKTLIPIGGDHARVTLSFRTAEGDWTLNKTWGAGNQARLDRPGQSSVVDPDKIQDQIHQLLVASPATIRTLMLARQGELVQTLENAGKESKILEDLGSLLRNAIREGGGVSVERLKDRVNRELEALSDHWDFRVNQPEQGRGIDRPWLKGVGKILEAYYRMEGLRRQHDEVLDLEEQQAKWNSSLSTNRTRQAALQAFLTQGQGAYEAEGKRELLDEKVRGLEARIKKQEADAGGWMRSQIELDQLKPLLETCVSGIRELETELSLSSASRQNANLRAQYQKVQLKLGDIETLKKSIATQKSVSPESLRQAQELDRKRETILAKMSAGKFVAKILSKAAQTFEWKSGTGASNGTWNAIPGEEKNLNAEGSLRIDTEAFTLHLTSGDPGMLDLPQELERVEGVLKSLLLESQCSTLHDLAQAHQERQQALQGLARLEAELKGQLGQETLESLTEKATAPGSEILAREFSIVQRELTARNQEKETYQRKVQEAETLIRRVKTESGLETPEELLVKAAMEKQILAVEKQNLANLPSIPEGMGSPAEFKQRFRQAQGELPKLSDEAQILALKKSELKFPDASAEDLNRQSIDAQARFQSLLQKARGLQKVLTAIERTDGDAGQLFEPLEKEFSERVGRLTLGRYGSEGKTVLEPGPARFIRQDRLPVPYSLLSSGMKDAVALSYRLTLSDSLLGMGTSFVLVDDPFVNLDSGRQQAAAEELKSFSKKAQVLFFTCHPAHAERLGSQNPLSIV